MSIKSFVFHSVLWRRRVGLLAFHNLRIGHITSDTYV